MHIARFWAMGSSGPFKCWRSSEVSLADAKARADADAPAIAARVKSGVHWKYGYPDRAVREEVLQQVAGLGGEIAWAVTRNAYGCDVLNTSRMVFVDVDHDGADAGRHLDDARRWTARHPGWSFRVYRTRAGLRLLATQALFLPDEAVIVTDLFPAMRTDPLYARLCKTQGSYRARLTPKPWRCGLTAPKERWPWRGADEEQRFLRWHERYREAAKRFATCELVEEIGARLVLAELAPVIKLHDQATGVGSGLPLA